MRFWEMHPAVVHFPIAFLLGGVALDLFGGQSNLFGEESETAVATATYLLIAGLASAVVAAATGVVSYYTVPGNHTEWAHQRVYWHIWAMVTAVVLFTVVCFMRWPHPSVVSPVIRWLGVAAAAILAFGGYIGGRLVYRGGLGVDPSILKPGLRHGTSAIDSPSMISQDSSTAEHSKYIAER